MMPVITWEVLARQGEDGHDDGLANVYLHKSGGYTRSDVNHIIDQLLELVQRMVPAIPINTDDFGRVPDGHEVGDWHFNLGEVPGEGKTSIHSGRYDQACGIVTALARAYRLTTIHLVPV